MGRLSFAIGQVTGLDGEASLSTELRLAEPPLLLVAQASRNAPRLGAPAASSIVRVRNSRRLEPRGIGLVRCSISSSLDTGTPPRQQRGGLSAVRPSHNLNGQSTCARRF